MPVQCATLPCLDGLRREDKDRMLKIQRYFRDRRKVVVWNDMQIIATRETAMRPQSIAANITFVITTIRRWRPGVQVRAKGRGWK
jgi:hypothetical protein